MGLSLVLEGEVGHCSPQKELHDDGGHVTVDGQLNPVVFQYGLGSQHRGVPTPLTRRQFKAGDVAAPAQASKQTETLAEPHKEAKRKRCVSGGVYVPCIYPHAR